VDSCCSAQLWRSERKELHCNPTPKQHAHTHAHTHSLTHARTHSLTHSLTHRGNTRHNPHEDALITLHTSRCAEKLRTIFAESGWDATLAPWLNGTLLDSLDQELLEEYIDMLRHLRLKCPRIMDARGLLDGKGSRRLAGSSALRSAVATPPEMNPGMEAVEWEFTVAPVLVLAPCEHSWSSVHLSGWKKRLAALGKVVSCQEVGLQFCSPSSSSSSFTTTSTTATTTTVIAIIIHPCRQTCV
jgi:hypothetical protein